MNTIEPFYEEVGQMIRKLRTKKRLSQEALGRLLNPPVTRASIANIEAGKQRILAHTLVQIAQILDVKLTEIAGPEKRGSTSVKIGRVSREQIETELAMKLSLPRKEIKELTAKLKTSNREHIE